MNDQTHNIDVTVNGCKPLCVFCYKSTEGISTVTVNGVHTCGEEACLDEAFKFLNPVRSFAKNNANQADMHQVQKA